MKTRQLAFMAVSSLALAVILLAGGLEQNTRADAYSVGANAYTIGSVSISPNTANPGTSVTLTGTGELPLANLLISMGGKFSDGQDYIVELGTAPTDSNGSWKFSFTVPSTVTRESDKASVPIFTAGWPVGGTALGSDGGLYDSYSYLNVYTSTQPGGSSQASSGTTSPTSLTSSSLPNTGARLAGFLLAGVSLTSFGALGLRMKRERRGAKETVKDE